ncbi:hypothetical protein OYC64_013215 [Pagothenia borchgrevinki]|uniref:LisH domain-containing protein n=1 Tax=Pagothenia borchgrevinki TaxID=8213 RepID=A0ABD2FT16_PAGBO
MSKVEAARRELTLLIYRHLKEHGFHSAAEELQKYSPQGETEVTESLLDIYRLWLSDKQPDSAKLSKRERNKAATKKKKDKLAIKEETEEKKTVPAKRKKSESKSGEKVIKTKKSKTQTKAQAVTGDDSDSDDSLDVDKWKKLLQQMTDSDMAKMDTINALDSAASPPVKKRVRKPRAKPPAKTITPNEQNTVGENNTMEEKAITETPTKKSKPKKSTSKKKAPVISSAAPSQEENINAVEDRAATPTLTSSKQDEIKDVTMIEEKTDETPSEPKKKKKKKKEMSEDNVKENTNDTGVEGKDGKKKKKSGVTRGTQGDSIEEEIIAKDESVDNVDTLEPRKKNKKKKAEKVQENTELIVEEPKETAESEEILEQKVEENG